MSQMGLLPRPAEDAEALVKGRAFGSGEEVWSKDGKLIVALLFMVGGRVRSSRNKIGENRLPADCVNPRAHFSRNASNQYTTSTGALKI
jgi:hypothetical protein